MPENGVKRLGAFVTLALLGNSLTPQNAIAVSESSLSQQWQSDIRPFLAKYSRTGTLEASNAKVAWRAVLAENPVGRVVFLPGAAASYQMYDEFLYDLVREGLSVFALDERGSGLSSGSVRKEEIDGHVVRLAHADSFDQTVADVELFLSQVVKAPVNEPPFFVGSSSGAVVAGLFAARNPDKIARMVFVNPLYEITFGNKNSAGSFAFLAGQVLLGKALLPLTSFGERLWEKGTTQTHSEPRRSIVAQAIASHPQMAVGGVTTLWAKALADASFRLEAESYKIRAPVLMMASLSDSIASVKAQDDHCRRMQLCTKITFEKAGHRILLERDEVRNSAIDALLRFFQFRVVSKHNAIVQGEQKAL